MTKYFKWIILTSVIVVTVTLASNVVFARVSTQTAGNADYVSGITAGRARSLIGGFVGLICLVAGWRTKRLAAKAENNVRSTAMFALIMGAVGLALSVQHLIGTAGAVFGSGSGKAGAIVAIAINSIGMVLAVLALRKANENGKREK